MKQCRRCGAAFEQRKGVRTTFYCTPQCARRDGAARARERARTGEARPPCEGCGGLLPRRATRWCFETACDDLRKAARREATRLRNGARYERDEAYQAYAKGVAARWRAENADHKRELDRAYYQANAEVIKARARARRVEDPEFVARERAAWQQRYRENPEFRARNQERTRAWIEANRAAWLEQSANYCRVRRARQRAATIVPFTVEQLRERLSVYDRCWICGDPRWTEADHVKPLAAGGPHMLANLRPACSTCNRQKGATWPFAPTRGT